MGVEIPGDVSDDRTTEQVLILPESTYTPQTEDGSSGTAELQTVTCYTKGDSSNGNGRNQKNTMNIAI